MDNSVKIMNNLKNEETKKVSEDDKKFRQRECSMPAQRRDNDYAKLLSHYKKIMTFRDWSKEFFKWIFFVAIIGFAIILIMTVKEIVEKYIYSTEEQIKDAIPLLITSMVGLVSTIIAIPIAITKYLFNSEEDKYIKELIIHTQEHDTAIIATNNNNKTE